MEKDVNSKNKERIRMELEKLIIYVFSLFSFIFLVVALGTLFPEYFGEASKLLLDNFYAFMVLVTFSIIIFVLSRKK